MPATSSNIAASRACSTRTSRWAIRVARLLYTDFPLGNPVGVPGDADMQRRIVAMALDLLVAAEGPRTTLEAPFRWPQGEGWKAKIFTEEQPFLDREATERWLDDKAEYRRLKSEDRI